jgi:ligand-binding SRPBCC domain-containing protein
MPIDIEAAQTIRAPVNLVWAFATDPANDTRWIGGLRSVRMVTSPPVGVGTRTERTAAFLGRPIQYVMEVDGMVTGDRLTMHSVAGPFPMFVTYRFTKQDDATRMTIRVQGGPGGLLGLLSPLLALAAKRNVASDLRRLRSLMER